MKRAATILATVGCSIGIALGDPLPGTVQFLNSALSKLTYQAEPSERVVDAPVGIKVGLFWGTTPDSLTLARPTSSITLPGLWGSGASTYPVVGTVPGQQIYVKIAAWDPEAGDDWASSEHYGESDVVRTTPLGPASGPGTIIWQSTNSLNPNRAKPFTLVRVRSLQTVSFPELPEVTFVDGPLILNATASSGLPVTYASSDPFVAIVDENILTITGVGTSVITATQAGSSNTIPVIVSAEASRTLTVRKAIASITLNSLTQEYNGTPLRPGVTTQPPGLPVTLRFDGSPTLPVYPGTYAVSAAVDSRNYAGSASGTFTIDKASQQITFPELPRAVLDGSWVVAAPTASSGLRVVLTSSDPTVASVQENVVTPIHPGTTTITASQEGDANYRPAESVSRLFAVDCLLTLSSSPGGTVMAEPALPAYPVRTVVQLTASPSAGYSFIRWTGDLSGRQNPASLTMTSNQSVAAVFASLAITVQSQGLGAIRKEPDLPSYELGQTVMLRAEPARWRAFSRWTDGATDNPRTVVVGESNVYTAVFIPEVPLETVTIGGITREAPVGMPAIVIDGVFQTNATIDVRGSAVVELMSSFRDAIHVYTIDGSEPDFLNARFYTGPFSLSASALLRAVAYPLDLSQSAASDLLSVRILPLLQAGTDGGGRVAMDPPAGPYPPDGRAFVTAYPDPGWSFLLWLGDAAGSAPITELTMDRGRCATAVFGTTVADETVGAGRVVRGPADRIHPFGSIVRLTAVPAPGAYFAFWANAVLSADNPLTFVVAKPQPTVTALFAPLPPGSHALTIIPEGLGHVRSLPQGTWFPEGTNVVLTAVPEAGQRFLGWEGDLSGDRNPVAFRMTSSVVVRARFTEAPRVSIVDCDATRIPDSIKLLVSGVPGRRYQLQSAEDPAASDWTERGVVDVPFGIAPYSEPILPAVRQRVFRAVEIP